MEQVAVGRTRPLDRRHGRGGLLGTRGRLRRSRILFVIALRFVLTGGPLRAPLATTASSPAPAATAAPAASTATPAFFTALTLATLAAPLVGVLARLLELLGLLLLTWLLMLLLGALTTLATPLLRPVTTALLGALSTPLLGSLSTLLLMSTATLLGTLGGFFGGELHGEALGEGHFPLAALLGWPEIDFLLWLTPSATAATSSTPAATSTPAPAPSTTALAVLEGGAFVGDAPRLELDFLFVIVVRGGWGRGRRSDLLRLGLLLFVGFWFFPGVGLVMFFVEVIFDGMELLGLFTDFVFDLAWRLGELVFAFFVKGGLGGGFDVAFVGGLGLGKGRADACVACGLFGAVFLALVDAFFDGFDIEAVVGGGFLASIA